MSKAILISIQPKWVHKILQGYKTIEIRKTKPKQYLNDKNFEAYDVYIYCTKNGSLENENNEMFKYLPYNIKGKVVAKFSLVAVESIKYHFNYYDMGEWTESYILENSCLTSEELDNYFQASKEYNEKVPSKVYGYAWHIEELEIFDKPKELSDFLIKSHKVQGIDKNGDNKTFTILKPLT